MTMMILSVSVSMGLLLLSTIFRVAGKLRLTLPVWYVLIAAISTMFTDWTTENEKLVMLGLYILIALIVLSWVVSFIKAIRARRQERYEEDDITWQIRRAREMGVPMTGITFDSSNSLIDPRTGKPVNYSAGR